MKDLNLSRLITIVATGSLLISPTGCGGKKDKDDDDDKVPEKEATLEGLCDVLQECAPDEFYAEYDNIADCLDEASQNYDENIENYGEECGESFLKFTHCLNQAWSESCDEYAFYEDCIPEILLVNANCRL